ncbi:MAG TPA: nitroreductase/quinone reductase family protein [Candidatus Limnocylindrales bacterium]|nr:nitroreductase/quinone reductase family protein [Candidatus Limnocylindrales bacterium]
MQYLYLTTRGRRTGLPREIEIWFTELNGRYYIIAERRENAQWVKNIRQDARVVFRVGEQTYKGHARIVEADQEPNLCARVRRLSEAKYGWGDGLIVELTPESE